MPGAMEAVDSEYTNVNLRLPYGSLTFRQSGNSVSRQCVSPANSRRGVRVRKCGTNDISFV